jgi:cytochrome c
VSKGALIVAGVAIAVFLGTLWVSVRTVGAERGRSERVQDLLPGADPARGPALIEAYGCGECHTIAAVRGANGMVGPPLTNVARRGFIAGSLPTTPENLVRWIRDPQGVEPGTAMPDLGIGPEDARDLAAYLYRVAGR